MTVTWSTESSSESSTHSIPHPRTEVCNRCVCCTLTIALGTQAYAQAVVAGPASLDPTVVHNLTIINTDPDPNRSLILESLYLSIQTFFTSTTTSTTSSVSTAPSTRFIIFAPPRAMIHTFPPQPLCPRRPRRCLPSRYCRQAPLRAPQQRPAQRQRRVMRHLSVPSPLRCQQFWDHSRSLPFYSVSSASVAGASSVAHLNMGPTTMLRAARLC